MDRCISSYVLERIYTADREKTDRVPWLKEREIGVTNGSYWRRSAHSSLLSSNSAIRSDRERSWPSYPPPVASLSNQHRTPSTKSICVCERIVHGSVDKTHLSENGKDRCSDIRGTVDVEDDQENALQFHGMRKDLLRGAFHKELEKLKNV